jgi:hypothetical protein
MEGVRVPPVPDGVNPFTVYLEALRVFFKPHPPPGLKARLAVLYVVTAA